jgi:hypothetical protein
MGVERERITLLLIDDARRGLDDIACRAAPADTAIAQLERRRALRLARVIAVSVRCRTDTARRCVYVRAVNDESCSTSTMTLRFSRTQRAVVGLAGWVIGSPASISRLRALLAKGQVADGAPDPCPFVDTHAIFKEVPTGIARRAERAVSTA